MVEAARVLGGRYRLVRPLGQGAMGSLWIAEHLALRSHVAIKLIRNGVIAGEDASARFEREARSAAALRSPHVVQILDHGVHEGTPYIAMELLEGETLAEKLERDGKLSALETGTILTHVSRALSRAHAHGIVHRDLKPSNIFVVSNDDELLVKVFDFGLAKAIDPSDSLAGKGTASGLILGTPYYMSPEQADNSRDIGVSTDIWAMGVVAYECLLGRVPFGDTSLRALVLAICTRPLPVPSQQGIVPPGFDTWFATACSRDLSVRYPSAKIAASEFQRLVLAQVPPTQLPADPRGPLGSSPELAAAAAPAAPSNLLPTQVLSPTQSLIHPLAQDPPNPLALSHSAPAELTRSIALPSTKIWFVRAAAAATLALVVSIVFALNQSDNGTGEQHPPALGGADPSQTAATSKAQLPALPQLPQQAVALAPTAQDAAGSGANTLASDSPGSLTSVLPEPTLPGSNQRRANTPPANGSIVDGSSAASAPNAVPPANGKSTPRAPAKDAPGETTAPKKRRVDLGI